MTTLGNNLFAFNARVPHMGFTGNNVLGAQLPPSQSMPPLSTGPQGQDVLTLNGVDKGLLNAGQFTNNSPLLTGLANAIMGLDTQDNGKVDGSTFEASSPQNRDALFQNLLQSDQADNGQVDGSIFSAAARGNQDFMQAFGKAVSGTSDAQAKNEFIDQLVLTDAADNGNFDGSVFNNIPQKGGLTGLLQKSLTKADLFRTLMGVDKKDDNELNGSVFYNPAMQGVLDLLDDGIANQSALNYINYLIHSPVEEEADSNIVNGYNLLNPNAGVSSLIEQAGLDKIHDMILKIFKGAMDSPYQTESFYGNPTMQTDPSHEVGEFQAGGEATEFGKKVAEAGKTVGGSRGTTGRCYAGVADSLAKVGVNVSGASAYMAADQLANCDKFTEVKVSREELKNLPAGAVVVWHHNQNGGGSNVSAAGKKHGHISIALGDGREASDHIQAQMTNRDATYRVFLPK